MFRISISALVGVLLVLIGSALAVKKSFLDDLLRNYDKDEVPSKFYQPYTTEVKTGIYVNGFAHVSSKAMEYNIIIYLRQSWLDTRLKNSTDGKKIRLPQGAWDRIWVPDTFIRNERNSAFYETTVINRFMSLNATGFIWYVMKLSLSLSCPMQLAKFPFDTQRCAMIVESFGYTADAMYLGTLDRPIDVDPGAILADGFTLVDTEVLDCSQNYTTGVYPCLQFEFVLRRSCGYYLLYYYLPTALIVVLSWLSFCISSEHSAIRVSQGILLVLTMTILSICVPFLFDLPRVSYVKAVDVWNIFCLTFIFTSLMEHCIVGVLSSMGNGGLFQLLCGRSSEDTDKEQHGMASGQGSSKSGKQDVAVIDKVCRWLFPLIFLLFVIVYFIVYLV